METNKSTHEAFKTELFAPIIKSTEGKYLAVLSDNSLDRDGERVGKSALYDMELDDGYLAALVDHENKALNQVAQWINKRVEEVDGHTALVAEPKFFKSNPKAQIIKGMLDEGAKMGISIGAIVKEYEDIKVNGSTVRTFTKLELLEASFVGIPSNKHGRAMALAKSFKEHMEVSEKMEITQKDVDDAVTKKVDELTKSFEEQLNVKELKIAELTKAVEESEEKEKEAEAAVVEAEQKVEEADKALEAEKKLSLEKQKFAEEEKEYPEEDADKAFKDGKIPVMRGI